MKKVLFCIAILGSLLSCSSDNENAASNAAASNKKNDDVLTFSYNGKSYSSSYDSSKNSLVLKDASVNDLYNKIQEKPELATYVLKDGSIEFYDTYADLKKSLNIKNSSASKSATAKTAAQIGQFFMYENTDRGGRHVLFSVMDGGLALPNVDADDFNDRLTSFEMVAFDATRTYVVTIFRDPNYAGRNYSFQGPSAPTGLYIRDLRGYTMTKKFPNNISWNDQMSSFNVVMTN